MNMGITGRLPLPWGEMAYGRRQGQGRPLLFLHGTGCAGADWAPTLAALTERSCLWLDFRGHGQSAVPGASFTLDDLAQDVLALLAALELWDVWLVGHSLGGMVALAAAQRSTRVAGLALLEGWTRLDVVAQAYDAATHLYGHLSAEAVARIREQYEQTRARFAPAQWEHFWCSVQRADAWEYLETTPLPILEVYGALGARPDAQAHLAIPQRPNIAWVWLQGAGHYLPHERPEDVAAICRHWLG